MSDREELHRAFPLESLGRELTALAQQDRLDPVAVSEPLVQRVATLLAAGLHPLLLGASGTGKNATVETLAIRLAAARPGFVPMLANRKIVECGVVAFQSGCLYVHEFETRVESIIHKCKESRTMLFLDQAHLAAGAGRVEGYEERTVATLLTPALARGELSLIGATTPEGYKTMLRRNPRFAGCFTPVEVPEHTAEATLTLLQQLRQILEARYRVEIQRESLPEIVRLAGRFYRGQAFPGKAFTLLKAALAERSLEATLAQSQVGRLTAHDIQTFVETRTGLPPFLLLPQMPVERQTLIDTLRAELFDQDPAIEAAVDAILTFKADLNDPERPVASFLLAGPTGVGKTELVKLVANLLFGSKARVLRYDMAEYADAGNVERLIGEGRGDGNHRGLVEEVLVQPLSVILLDEIEKAHPSIYSVLLPVLGEGRLTDASGRTVSFANSVIFLTSNLGAELYGRRTIGLRQSGGDPSVVERAILERIRAFFPPEFVNRLTKILLFKPLSRAATVKVAEKMIKRAIARPGLQDRRLHVTVDPSLFDQLLEQGFHSEYGARPMERAVQELVVYPLARALANGRITSNQKVMLTYADRQSALRIQEEKARGRSRHGSKVASHGDHAATSVSQPL